LRQHKHWRRAERARDSASYARAAFEAALETAPEGYFAWFAVPSDASDDGLPSAWRRTPAGGASVGVCSRRLAVLLDLLHGLAPRARSAQGGNGWRDRTHLAARR